MSGGTRRFSARVGACCASKRNASCGSCRRCSVRSSTRSGGRRLGRRMETEDRSRSVGMSLIGARARRLACITWLVARRPRRLRLTARSTSRVVRGSARAETARPPTSATDLPTLLNSETMRWSARSRGFSAGATVLVVLHRHRAPRQGGASTRPPRAVRCRRPTRSAIRDAVAVEASARPSRQAGAPNGASPPVFRSEGQPCRKRTMGRVRRPAGTSNASRVPTESV